MNESMSLLDFLNGWAVTIVGVITVLFYGGIIWVGFAHRKDPARPRYGTAGDPADNDPNETQAH